jgi:hypothetical protein
VTPIILAGQDGRWDDSGTRRLFISVRWESVIELLRKILGVIVPRNFLNARIFLVG